jgi:two-component system nitrogen regulation response regulator GlnG
MRDSDEAPPADEATASEDPAASTQTLLPMAAAEAVALKLVVVSGRDFGKTLALEKGAYRVGKSPEADLELTDSAVSRQHLVVEPLRGGCRFRDEGSTNGAFFDGSRFSVIEVPTGAVVRVGQTELQVLPAARPNPLRPSDKNAFGRLLGEGLRMRQIFGLLERAAAGGADVLLQGETGTGKELAAEGLHTSGPRAAGPFVICDLAGTTPSLVESELFGHVRGAFTGAIADRAGAFERAHGGTLFLDEIGDLGLELQPRLLRALERRQVKRVGSDRYTEVDVRVVTASHKDLEEEVRAGRFREDLYHRVAVVTVTLPPLRERPEDLPMLVRALLERAGHRATATAVMSAETQTLLRSHDWPGNVRELRNVIERAIRLGVDPDLPERSPSERAETHSELPFKAAKEHLVTAFERDYLAALLERVDGNVSMAARESGIGRVYLHRLLKKHGLARSSSGE